MDGKMDETAVSYAERFNNISTNLEDKQVESIGLGTKLLSCVHRLVLHPKIPDVRQFLGSGMASQKFTLADVKDHSDSDSCWIVLRDKVYDVTEFLSTHPGGEEIILENAGSDATVPFESKGHSTEAYNMLEQYCIGALTECDRRL